jgi:peptide-methionine (R)-S-oxide reductase
VKITKTDDQWRQELTPEQYQVTRQHGTERAFSNPLNGEKRAGMFNCVCCGAPLFSASTKFDSGTGPSFWAPVAKDAVTDHDDRSWFHAANGSALRVMRRASRSRHRPKPTGARYCMNGVALKFAPDDGDKK